MLALTVHGWRSLNQKTRRLIVGLAAGIALPIICTVVAGALDAYLQVRAPSMTFLCGVIVAAIWLGRTAALGTAVFAFLIYNFYLAEPRYAIGFAGYEDALTLLIFVGVALLLGGLAGHLHDERERAREQARVFSALFEVSRSMAACGAQQDALDILANGVTQVAAKDTIIFQEGAPIVGEAPPPGAVAAAAFALLRGETALTDNPLLDDWRMQVLEASGKRVAVLAWRPLVADLSSEHAIAVRLLTELTISAIERTQNLELQVEMDTLAATEKLRTALMSSISHDFRTPLSTILTSVTSLQAYDDRFAPSTRADLLSSIQEEAERLNRFVSNILNMTRLDIGVVKPREEWIDPIEILDAIQERINDRLGQRRLQVMAPAAVPSLCADALLLEQALLNVVENALVHTHAGCTIQIGVAHECQTLRLWVEDDGPGVPPEDLPRIFDKFHRVASTENTQGAGLGLAISKGFIEAMCGEVNAVCPAANGRGLRIDFVFPMQAAMANT